MKKSASILPPLWMWLWEAPKAEQIVSKMARERMSDMGTAMFVLRREKNWDWESWWRRDHFYKGQSQ